MKENHSPLDAWLRSVDELLAEKAVAPDQHPLKATCPQHSEQAVVERWEVDPADGHE